MQGQLQNLILSERWATKISVTFVNREQCNILTNLPLTVTQTLA